MAFFLKALFQCAVEFPLGAHYSALLWAIDHFDIDDFQFAVENCAWSCLHQIFFPCFDHLFDVVDEPIHLSPNCK